MKKYVYAVLSIICISSSVYSQCPTTVIYSLDCNGLTYFSFGGGFMGSGEAMVITSDFGDLTTGYDSLNYLISHTYSANGTYNAVFIIEYYDTTSFTLTCSDTIAQSVVVTNVPSQLPYCGATFTPIQYCMDSISFWPGASYPSFSCGYYVGLDYTITNYGDTIWSYFGIPASTNPWPDSVTFNYTYWNGGSPYLQCATTVPVPLMSTNQLYLFVDTNSIPTITVHDTSSTNMYFVDIDWGDGFTQQYIGTFSSTHFYFLDGTYQVLADATPSSMYDYYNYWLDSTSGCLTYDSTLVEIRGMSNFLSCNLNPVVNYNFGTQQLDFALWYWSQQVTSPNLDVSWSFSNGMTSTSDFGSVTSVSPGPTSFTVTYTIYDFWGNVECTNTTTMAVNTIYPSCNALVYIYEDTLVPGLYWAVDQSTGGLPPYTYLWDFGDGTTSTLQFPTHTYAIPAVYSVCLTITDSQVPPCISTYCDDSVGLAPLNSMVDRSPNPVYQINVYNPGAIGVEENIHNDFNLFPNPVSDYIILNAGENYSEDILISLMDVAGQMLQSKRYNNNGSITIGLEDLSSGVYLLRIEDGSKLATKKFIKK